MRSKLSTTILTAMAVLSLCAFKIQIKNGKIQVDGANKSAPAPARNTASAAPANTAAPAADPKPTGGTCDASASIGLCYLFVGKKNTDKQASQGNQMACKLFRGQFSVTAPCPPSGRLGTCTIKGGGPEEYRLIYYPVKFDAAKAQADCANPKSSIHIQGAGTWQPG